MEYTKEDLIEAKRQIDSTLHKLRETIITFEAKENPNLTYESVYKEMMAQIKQIEKFGKGKLKLNHITCHHHLGDNAIIRQVVYDITKLLNLPIRRVDYSADFDINKPFSRKRLQ